MKNLNNVLGKVNRTIGLLCKLQAFFTTPIFGYGIIKAFIRSHLDYGNIIYDQTYDDSFHQEMESIRYNASLAKGITRGTGATRGISREKLYQELGLK